MKRTAPMICLTLCLLPAIAAADPSGGSMTLAEAVNLALEHAPAMQAAEAERDAASEDADIGRAGLLPFVQATGSIQQRRQNTSYDKPQNFFKTDLNYTETFVGLRLVQPLFDLSRWAGYRQGELSAQSGELKLRLERQKLMLETALTALEVATAREALDAAEAQERAAAKAAAEAAAAYRAGTRGKTEKLEAESRRDLAAAARLAAGNRLLRAEAALASMTGTADTAVVMPAIADHPAAYGVSDSWQQQAQERSVPVLLSQKRLEMAEQQAERSLGTALPKVEAFAEVGRDRQGDTMLNSPATVNSNAVGVQVRVPLYAGGGTTAQMRKDESSRLAAGYALADDVRLARLSAQQAWLALSDAAVRITAMRQAVLSARQASDAIGVGYRAGLRNIGELLDADERLHRAEADLATARAQLVAASLQLKASAGRLDGEPLPAIYGGAL